MKCAHLFGTSRHKRQADLTLLIEYILIVNEIGSARKLIKKLLISMLTSDFAFIIGIFGQDHQTPRPRYKGTTKADLLS